MIISAQSSPDVLRKNGLIAFSRSLGELSLSLVLGYQRLKRLKEQVYGTNVRTCTLEILKKRI